MARSGWLWIISSSLFIWFFIASLLRISLVHLVDGDILCILCLCADLKDKVFRLQDLNETLKKKENGLEQKLKKLMDSECGSNSVPSD